jgi:hypothetical protein
VDELRPIRPIAPWPRPISSTIMFLIETGPLRGEAFCGDSTITSPGDEEIQLLPDLWPLLLATPQNTAAASQRRPRLRKDIFEFWSGAYLEFARPRLGNSEIGSGLITLTRSPRTT